MQSRSTEDGGDASRRVVRLLGARDDAASRVAVTATREVPPRAIGMLLEAAAAGDAGDRRKAPIAYGECREVVLDRDRFGKRHAGSVRLSDASIGGAPVSVPMRFGCK